MRHALGRNAETGQHGPDGIEARMGQGHEFAADHLIRLRTVHVDRHGAGLCIVLVPQTLLDQQLLEGMTRQHIVEPQGNLGLHAGTEDCGDSGGPQNAAQHAANVVIDRGAAVAQVVTPGDVLSGLVLGCGGGREQQHEQREQAAEPSCRRDAGDPSVSHAAG